MTLKTIIDLFNEKCLEDLNSKKREYQIYNDKKGEGIIYKNCIKEKETKIKFIDNYRIAGIYSNHSSNKIEFEFDKEITRYSTSFRKYANLIKKIAKEKNIKVTIDELSKIAIIVGFFNSIYHLVYTIEHSINVLSDTRRENMLEFQHEKANEFLDSEFEKILKLINNV